MAEFGKPTVRQEQVLTIIEEWLEEQGYPPTIREIGRELGLKNVSRNAASCHLKALEKKGWISRMPKASRGIRLNYEVER